MTFVHVYTHETPDGGDALRTLPAFQAFRAGLADRVLPLDELGLEIVSRVRKGRSASVAGRPA